MVGGEKDKVSIIVVNWNGERLLGDCLEALSRQTYAHCEIILVDNGSSDGSVRLARQRFPGTKIVKLATNTGFTGGNTAGLAVAGGEFIALVNNDARPAQMWLENLIQPMLEEAAVGICASKVMTDSTSEIDSAGNGLTTAGSSFNRGLGREESFYNDPGFVFGGSGAAVLYRREMLDEIGFFDEDFFLYYEDTDLSFRAQLSGWKCVYVPKALVLHKGNASAGKLSDAHVYYHARNVEFVWIKNMPSALMLRFAHHKLIQEIGGFCYLCLRHGKWGPFFKAKKDALKMVPAMVAKRREIQKKRRMSNHYVKGILTPILNKEIMRQKVMQFIRG